MCKFNNIIIIYMYCQQKKEIYATNGFLYNLLDLRIIYNLDFCYWSQLVNELWVWLLERNEVTIGPGPCICCLQVCSVHCCSHLLLCLGIILSQSRFLPCVSLFLLQHAKIQQGPTNEDHWPEDNGYENKPSCNTFSGWQPNFFASLGSLAYTGKVDDHPR